MKSFRLNKHYFRRSLAYSLIVCGLIISRCDAQVSLQTIHSFTGQTADGAAPRGNLILGTDGSIYGTSSGGSSGFGTIFKIANGSFSTIASFTDPTGAGVEPDSGILIGADGNVYGTTPTSGSQGEGTVYRMTSSGLLTAIHTFGDTAQGHGPAGGLVDGGDGYFYGVTVGGGAGRKGTVYKMTPAGDLATLHSFLGPDGYYPTSGLVKGTDGNFYGVTSEGGRHYIDASRPGYGTIFKITPAGSFTLLYSFPGPGVGGVDPSGSLVVGTDGNFYGVTAGDDTTSDYGTIFKVTPHGRVTTLHSFLWGPTTQTSGGLIPVGSLIRDTGGNFYGTTADGGAGGGGTIFEITPTGHYASIFAFAGSNGGVPVAGMVQAADGSFFGTTALGGDFNHGTVFQFTITLVAPQNLSVRTYSHDATVSWDIVPGAATYNVYQGTTPGGESSTPVATGMREPTAKITGLTNGQTYYFSVKAVNNGGTGPASSEISAIPTDIVDFNGDDLSDILLQDTASNALTIWTMNGAGRTGIEAVAFTPASSWDVGGVVDYNGDDKADILFRNTVTRQIAVYLMDGNTAIGGYGLSLVPPVNSALVATGDFDGDGRVDIALQDTVNNRITIWLMNGGVRLSATVVLQGAPTGWHVVGAADFDNDDKADLVLQDTVTNQAMIWYMNGGLRTGTTALPTPAAGLKISAIADYNGDGHPDIVLQDSGSHALTVWSMNNATRLASHAVVAVPSATQVVVGPR